MRASVADAGLVRIATSQVGEGVTGVMAGVAADIGVFLTVDDLRLSGSAGYIQVGCVAAMLLFWTVSLAVYRPRELRAFSNAVPVEDPVSLRSQGVAQRRYVRQGCVRVAGLVLVFTLICAYYLHRPVLGLGLQLVFVLSLLHTWRTVVAWERRHGLALWKPPLSVVGQEAWSRSPYFVTPAAAQSLG